MKFIEHNGEELALFLAPPDWAEELRVELDLPFTEITSALSTQESRRTFGRSARYSLEYAVSTYDFAGSTELRVWLNRLTEELVAVPMWQDAVEIAGAFGPGGSGVLFKTATNPVQYGAEWIILSPDRTVYEIVAAASCDNDYLILSLPATRAWPAGTIAYPLLFGRVVSRPQFSATSDELLNGRIRFREDSPYARRLNPFVGVTPTVGPGIPEFSSLPLFSIAPEESVAPLDTTSVEATTRAIGFLRQDQRLFHPQYVRRGLELHFHSDDRVNIAAITRFFVERRGPVKTFMVPTFRSDLRLKATDELLYGLGPTGTAIEPG